MLKFLKSVLIFNEWTARQLSFLYYKIEVEHFIYKQTTNKPKSDTPYMYIIKDGEFEHIDRVKISQDVKFIIGDRITVKPANLPWKSNIIQSNVICKKLLTGKY
jgi:signal-transduction protein with cAMP-binding, CBS, and nucleotidyltransferase domain